MRHKVPKFSNALTESSYEDIYRFAKLDRKAYETLFKPVDASGHTLIYYRDKQYQIFSRYLMPKGERSPKKWYSYIREAMLARCVDPDITKQDMTYFSNNEHRLDDKRRKR
ncbi:MAG: hypothetical protein PUG13_00860 [Streptococcus hyointestinalis]|nr:hypothetical protein [Streptococcus hyointestinalis]MDD6383957.1 hypothetical protein [Streptococcus hyointestinalis]